MKTKLEIIEETARAYNINTRSINDIGHCKYDGPKGRKCAFGRCCESNKITPDWEGHTTKTLLGQNIILSIDSVLKEEYRGHDVFFWYSIQSLHDRNSNWNESGLSDEGKKRVEELKSQYSRIMSLP